MKKEHKLIILLAIITIYIVLVPTVILPFFSSYYLHIINPIFWIILFIITYFFFRDFYVRNKYNKYLAKNIFYITLVFVIAFFLLGFVFGFKISILPHTFKGIIINFISFVVVLLIEEYIRYYLINSIKNKFNFYVLVTFIFTILDIVLYFKITSNMSVYKFIFLLIISNMMINILCSFLAYKKSLYSTLLVRGLPILIYILIPVVPKINWILFTIIAVSYCIFALTIINNNLKKLSIIENKIKIKKNREIKLVILTVFTILVMFIIGLFDYVPISIASKSMLPNISVGDAVIYKKYDNAVDNLEVGNIIVYIKNNIIIVHRILKLKEINGELNIITKGDNNEAVDNWIVKSNDIIGVYKFKIPYIGYPAALLHNMFGKE